MTITLDLPPETEALFQEAARSEGIDLATFLREAAEARLHPAPPPAAMSEAELLDKITEGFSEAFWQRYRAFIARRDSGTLTPPEQAELIACSDRTETRAAQRLVYLTELSARRGITVKLLMHDLNIRPPLHVVSPVPQAAKFQHR
jgi:hypothetical protein